MRGDSKGRESLNSREGWDPSREEANMKKSGRPDLLAHEHGVGNRETDQGDWADLVPVLY